MTTADGGEPTRILVVDDVPDNVDILDARLSSRGYAVQTAANGEQALERVKEEPPHLILLDVMMPGMDGPSTVLALQADPLTRDIPVIFLTAKVQAVDRRRLADLGALGIIAKPFDPMTLAEEVTSLLQGAAVST